MMILIRIYYDVWASSKTLIIKLRLNMNAKSVTTEIYSSMRWN